MIVTFGLRPPSSTSDARALSVQRHALQNDGLPFETDVSVPWFYSLFTNIERFYGPRIRLLPWLPLF